jgi:cell division septum initiation protein DivIVA
VDLLSLLDRLEHLITSSQRMPMTNRVLVREQDVLQLVDEIRAALPEEMKQAHRIYQERDRLLAQAEAEANRIIGAAREEAERLINDDEVLRLAAERAAEIESEAEEQAGNLRNGADAYAVQTLRDLEDRLNEVQVQLERTVLGIHKGVETLHERARAKQDQYLKEQEQELAQGEEEGWESGTASSVPQRAH